MPSRSTLRRPSYCSHRLGLMCLFCVLMTMFAVKMRFHMTAVAVRDFLPCIGKETFTRRLTRAGGKVTACITSAR